MYKLKSKNKTHTVVEQTDIDGIKDNIIASVTESLNTRISALEEKDKVHDNKINQNKINIGDLQTEVSGINVTLTTQGSQLTAMSDSVDSLKNDVKALKAKDTELSNSIQTNTTDITTIKKELSDIKAGSTVVAVEDETTEDETPTDENETV